MALDVDVQISPSLEMELGSVRALAARIAASRRAAALTCRAVGVQHAQISITWLTDDEITTLNRDHLGHEGPTDVISFELYAPGELPVGDIYIGYAQAMRQAESLREDGEMELIRLAVHGTLHVLGFDHPVRSSREQSEMWLLQEAIVDDIRAGAR